jgi:hypothetical protein
MSQHNAHPGTKSTEWTHIISWYSFFQLNPLAGHESTGMNWIIPLTLAWSLISSWYNSSQHNPHPGTSDGIRCLVVYHTVWRNDKRRTYSVIFMYHFFLRYARPGRTDSALSKRTTWYCSFSFRYHSAAVLTGNHLKSKSPIPISILSLSLGYITKVL